MKLFALTALTALGSSAALVHTGVMPCPCDLAARVIHGGGCDGPSCAAEAAPAGVTAEYLEARDCTVFGGACHINGESPTQGRSALAAWRFAGGGKLAAAIESDTNLGAGGARRAVLFVDGASADEVALAVAGAGLEVLARHTVPVAWQRDGDAFHVAVEDVLDLAGQALADRLCCSMPSAVWYAPLVDAGGASVAGAVVGNPSRCRFVGQDGLAGWRYEDANTAFLGTFTAALAAP